MKRIPSFYYLLLIVISVIMASCSQKSKMQSLTLTDDDASTNEKYFGIISGYTCGFISENEPLQVQFDPSVKLKKTVGESLSNKTFVIKPKISGTAYWIDDHTIGYKFNKRPDKNKKYQVTFNVNEFVDIPKDCEKLVFFFMIRAQDFCLVNTSYSAINNTSCSYSFDVQFTNPIEPEVALSMLDESISKYYHVSSYALSTTRVKIQVNDIERTDKERKITIKLNGKKIDIRKNISTDINIPSTHNFSVVGYFINKADKSVNIQYSNPLTKNQNLAGMIEMSKSVGYRTDISDNQLIIYFDEYPDLTQAFSLKVLQGINDIYNNKNSNDYSIDNLVIDELLPKIKWSEDGVIVPDIDSTTVLFDAIALKNVTVRFIKVFDSNILRFMQENEMDETWNIRQVGRLVKKVHIALNTNNYDEWKTFKIRLSDYIDVKHGDLYQISINFDMSDIAYPCDSVSGNHKAKDKESDYWDNNANDYKTYYYDNDWWNHSKDPCYPSYYNDVEIKKNILVTNLAITAKSAFEKKLDVFVRNITDATPSNKTTVTAFNYQLQELGHAKTDDKGYCSIYCSNIPYIVTAKDSKGNKSFLRLDKNKSLSLSKFDVSGNATTNDINGFIYSNRDVWRPGDSIFINFMLSDKNKRLPDNFPVVMEIYDSHNRLYCKKVNNHPTGNIYAFSSSTNVNDATGTWIIDIKLGNMAFSKSIRIETIKPNRLQIDFKVPEMISLSQSPMLKLKSQWLNGIKASNLSSSIEVNLSKSSTKFNKYPGYSFENEANDFNPVKITLFSATLDADGTRNISIDPLKSVKGTGFMSAKFTVKVFEPDGNFSISTTHTQVSPCERYIGVSLPETPSKYGEYYFTNRNWSFPVIVVKEDGTIENKDVKLDYYLYKLDSYWWWSNNNKGDLGLYTSGTYQRPIKNGILYCNQGKANLALNINDNEWGSYFLVIKDNISGSIFSKIIFFDSENFSRSNSLANTPALIQLKSDKDTYTVGEKINIKFPANKYAKAFATVETASNIIETIDLDNLSDNATLSFTATDNMAPNIYVYVSLLQPYKTTNNLPVRMYGVLPLKIEPKNSTLEPVINMPEQTNSNKTITIKVSEKKGKAMYYTLAIVDEGILGLTSYKTADPYNYFFSKQALNIRTWDNYQYVIDAYTGEMLSVMAIGGDMSIIPPETTLSERFSTVAYSLGPFKLAAGKTVSHSIKIPEYLGALRVMVVASNDNNAFGSVQKDIKVKNPLMVIPTTPRIVAPNDKFILPLQVVSPDNPNKEVKINISTKNLIVAKPNLNVKLNNTGDGTAYCEISVPNVSGTAELTVKSSIGSHSTSSTIKMPIRTPFTPKHDFITYKIESGKKHDFNVNVNGIAGTAQGKVTVNSIIPLDLYSKLDYLVSYPYGCLEQTISSAFPQLYLEALTTLDNQTKTTARQNVEAAISSINAFVHNDYSLSSWKGSNYVNPWAEIYATHFLIEAHNAGYKVSNNMINGIIKHQATKAKTWVYNSDHPTDDAIQAYRLFVLALNNTPETGAMNKLHYQNNLQQLSKALLASSYALSGKTNIAKEIIPTIDYSTKTRLSDYYITYGSPVRDMAFCTYAEMLCGSNQQYLRKYIDEIANAVNSKEWMDTQTAAFSLFVLEKYAHQQGFNNSPLNAVISVNGTSSNVNTDKSSATQNFNPKPSNVITVTNRSKSPVFASIYTRYMVADYEYAEKGNGYKMSVKYYDKNGKPFDPTSVKRNTDFYVEITIINPSVQYRITENVLSYYIPAGWEIVNDRLFGSNTKNENNCNFIDMRDDRVYFFFDLMQGEKKTFRISFNAAYQGTYTIPQVTSEDMYNNKIFYTIPAKKITVL